MNNYALRIRRNERLINGPDESPSWQKAMEHFVRRFPAGSFLNWEAVPWEDNHGPGPSMTWYSGSHPTTLFVSQEKAEKFWNENGLTDVVVDIVKVSYEIVSTI